MSSTVRMEMYEPHRTGSRSKQLHKRLLLSELGGFKVYTVDGAFVRKALDIDFVAGGNPGRYAYVPEGELWVEEVYTIPDLVCTAYHEAVEALLMIHDHFTYERAHDIACRYEHGLRRTAGRLTLEGLSPLVFETYVKESGR